MIGFRYRQLFLAGVLVLGLFQGVAVPETPREYYLKAAFIYNFAKFVEWPAESFKNNLTPITLTILGSDPFGAALETLKDQTVQGRKIIIKRTTKGDNLEGCQILFICASEKTQYRPILAAIKNLNILTVSDMDKFAAQGGMIGLIKVDDKLHFEINLEAVQRTKLKISSQLLKLAKIIPSGERETME